MAQMTGGFGGMLSLKIAGGERETVAIAAKANLWKRATSLGGVESLIEHRASIEGDGSLCPQNLLRLSTGLENVDDLIGDIETAITEAGVRI
jgi:cystathionine gamma-synthase